MFASENLANLIIFVSLSQHLALWRLVVLKVQYVKSSTLVGTSSRCLLLQCLHLFSLSLALIVHKLPTLQVTLILLNSIKRCLETALIISFNEHIPFLLDLIEPDLVLLLSECFVMRSEVTVPAVLLRQEVATRGIWVVQQRIIHVLVILTHALP
jgi:hypothetical protein